MSTRDSQNSAPKVVTGQASDIDEDLGHGMFAPNIDVLYRREIREQPFSTHKEVFATEFLD